MNKIISPPLGSEGGSDVALTNTSKRPEPMGPMQRRARRQRYGRLPRTDELPLRFRGDEDALDRRWPRRLDADDTRHLHADRPIVGRQLG